MTAQGSNLTYKGQSIYLRGANVHNVPCENGWKGRLSTIQIKEADYAKLAEMGENHFRFDMAFGRHTYERDKFWQVLDQHVAWRKETQCLDHLKLFSTPQDQESSGWRCNSLASQEGPLGDFLVEMANSYKNEPALTGYDIIN